MKYNKSDIMKKAWEIKRKSGNTFSASLKMAWSLAKAILTMKKEDYVEDGTVDVRFWFNYGKARAYITRSWVSNFQNKKGYYVDLETGRVRL